MVGEESVRIIVTHADIEANKEGYSEMDVKQSVSRLADISIDLIKVVGTETSAEDIEDFMHATLLSEPVHIKLNTEGAIKLASGASQSRRISKAVRDIHGKIDAAASYFDVLTNFGTNKTYEKDLEILDVQHATSRMVGAGKKEIFRDAVHLTVDEQTICYAQAGGPLSIKLKSFLEKTNLLLSWNVTDTADPRNHYRACNYCGAIFSKVEGCDGETRCGAIPTSIHDTEPSQSGNFHTWFSWYMDGATWGLRAAQRTARQFFSQQSTGVEQHTKRSDAVFESGCGRSINWSTMHPIDAAMVALLGFVEVAHVTTLEELSNRQFHVEVEIQEELHKLKLQDELK